MAWGRTCTSLQVLPPVRALFASMRSKEVGRSFRTLFLVGVRSCSCDRRHVLLTYSYCLALQCYRTKVTLPWCDPSSTTAKLPPLLCLAESCSGSMNTIGAQRVLERVASAFLLIASCCGSLLTMPGCRCLIAKPCFETQKTLTRFAEGVNHLFISFSFFL